MGKPGISAWRALAAVQQPERLDYTTVLWDRSDDVPRALIPANRVDEFVENEGVRCNVSFFVWKTRGNGEYKQSDQVCNAFAPNTRQKALTVVCIL